MSILSDFRTLEADVGDLVARHEQAESAADYTKYADDPAGFFRDVLDCEPWAKQVEMAERIRDKPIDKTGTLVVTCNGLGKDWATARIALWWVYARRGFVILTGPTERQVKNILMKEVRRAWGRVADLPGELFALALHVSDDCGILGFTSDDGDKLTGFHHPRLLVCVTEGQGVDPEAYEAARKCCTGAQNRLFVYGNPNAPTGPFYEAATSDTWDVLTIAASEHPNVVSGREEIPGAVTREWIAQQAREYGETSPIYLSSVLAQFPDVSVHGLIQRDWIRAAFDRHTPELLEIAWRYPLLLSLDVARFGTDSSVLAYIRGPIVVKLETWHGKSTTDSANYVDELAKASWNPHERAKILSAYPHMATPPKILVDGNGVGGGVVDRLREKGHTVIEYNGSHKAFDEKRHMNMRASSHWAFRELLENNEVAIPRDKMLEEEALAVEWQMNPSRNVIQIVGKDTVREKLKRSPDRLDAVVMGLGYSAGNLRRVATWGTYVI